MKDNIETLEEDVDLFKKKIIKINEDILKPAQKQLEEAQQKLAENLCFCNVGDKIQEGGKDPIVVTNIYYKIRGYGIRGRKIKNSGELYKYDHDVWAWDGFDDFKVINKNREE